MDTQKGFHKGIAAMRKLLAKEFSNQGSARFSGYEIAQLIEQAPGPPKEEEEKQTTVRIPS